MCQNKFWGHLNQTWAKPGVALQTTPGELCQGDRCRLESIACHSYRWQALAWGRFQRSLGVQLCGRPWHVVVFGVHRDSGLFLLLLIGSLGAQHTVPCSLFRRGRGRSPLASHKPFGCLWRHPRSGLGRLQRSGRFVRRWLLPVFFLPIGRDLRFPFVRLNIW